MWGNGPQRVGDLQPTIMERGVEQLCRCGMPHLVQFPVDGGGHEH